MKLEEIEKLFVKLPKLFHPKFKPVIAGSYTFCITPKNRYGLLLNDFFFESYNTWLLDKAFQDAYANKFIVVKHKSVMTYDDIKSFPNKLRRKIMHIFLNTLRSALKKENQLSIETDMPYGGVKELRFNSIEELFMKVDMNDIE